MGLLVAPMIVMKENQIKYWGGGGSSSAIQANMTYPVALEVARTTHHARFLVHLSALTTATPVMLASHLGIRYRAPLSQTSNTRYIIFLPLLLHLQINLLSLSLAIISSNILQLDRLTNCRISLLNTS